VIDWVAFLSVAGAALVASVVVVGFYSVGLRLLDASTAAVGAARKTAAVACFVVCAAAVLFGIYLIVPAFHGA